MIVDRAKVEPGEDVLIWGAGGGLGVFRGAALQNYRCACDRSGLKRRQSKARDGARGTRRHQPKRVPQDAVQRRHDARREQGAFGPTSRVSEKKIWEILGGAKRPGRCLRTRGQSHLPCERVFGQQVWPHRDLRRDHRF